MNYIKRILTSILLLSPISVYALNYDSPMLRTLKGVQFSAAGGPTWTTVDDTSLVISNFETDNVIPTNVTQSATWKVGIGYHFLEEKLKQRRFFNDLLVELNIYRNAETVKGDVWRYQLPEFNNYRFTAPITSTRFMIDVKPGLFTTHRITVYPIIGLGAALTDVSYSEAVVGSGTDPNSYHTLGTDTNLNVAYDLGLGLSTMFNDHFGASLECIYSYVIDVAPAAESTSQALLQSAPEFTVSNQTVLLGVNWKI